MNYSTEEIMISVIARQLQKPGIKHVAVGAASPIPGSAALLANHLTQGRVKASVIHGIANNPFSDGGREIFDCAAQGRVDVFFLGGVQIDGEANVNLVGTGGEYPRVDRRFPGSFGSAYLYFIVPNVFLFRPEHTRRVFVPKVDFVSAPGTSEPNVYRPGGAKVLITELCLMSFDRQRRRFRLESVHPGHTLEEILDNTGFDFDIPEVVPMTKEPEPEYLSLLRGPIGDQIREVYPNFVDQVLKKNADWPVGKSSDLPKVM